MCTWKHKDIWNMEAKDFAVKITREDLKEGNSWRIIAIIRPDHPLYKEKSYEKIYKSLPFPKGYFDGELIIGDKTHKEVEYFYIGKQFSGADCKRDAPEIFYDGERIYNMLEEILETRRAK